MKGMASLRRFSKGFGNSGSSEYGMSRSLSFMRALSYHLLSLFAQFYGWPVFIFVLSLAHFVLVLFSKLFNTVLYCDLLDSKERQKDSKERQK